MVECNSYEKSINRHTDVTEIYHRAWGPIECRAGPRDRVPVGSGAKPVQAADKYACGLYMSEHKKQYETNKYASIFI